MLTIHMTNGDEWSVDTLDRDAAAQLVADFQVGPEVLAVPVSPSSTLYLARAQISSITEVVE